MSIKTIKWGIATLVCIAGLAGAACKNGASPTAPSTTTVAAAAAPAPTPAPTPAPAVVATASVLITITPNPVAFSGQPITDAASCVGSPNTWFYQQTFKESGGAAVTLTSRIDKFDERVVNTVTTLNLAIPANGSMTLQSRWCSAAAVSHTAQSSFSGIDANGHPITIDGPLVSMKSP